MSDVVAAVVAEAETEQTEVAAEAAIDGAEIRAAVETAAIDGAVEVAQIQADAAVAIAEAQSTKVDEQWLATRFANIDAQMSQLAASQAEMAAAISQLATLSIPTPPLEPVIVEPAEAPIQADMAEPTPEPPPSVGDVRPAPEIRPRRRVLM